MPAAALVLSWLQRFQVPVEMGFILRLHRGHVDHTPDVTCAVLMPHQQAQQLPDVSPIALGPTLATIDLNRGGISHGVGEPLGLQKPMQPEAFATRFVTTNHRRNCAQTKARFGMGYFVELRVRSHAAQ